MSFGPLLFIEGLTVVVDQRVLLREVSLDLCAGEILAIAGGSGSGKTTIGLSVMRLLPEALSIAQGRILFEGEDLVKLPMKDLRRYRGAKMGMIFQDPLSAFDPLFTIGQQLDEALVAHTALLRQERYKKILAVLSEVQLTDPKRVYQSFPHQLSGGMRQRAMVASAIICDPVLIIADEPTSSLDLTVQAKMRQLFEHLKAKNIAILLIAHDLGLVARLADRVIILDQGQIVEQGWVASVMNNPSHPYTQALVAASK